MKYSQKSYCHSVSETQGRRTRRKSQAIVKLFVLHAKAVKKQQEKAIASFFSLDKAVIVVKTPSYIKLH